jgi:tetratricopeptide (TPR) repeat protein
VTNYLAYSWLERNYKIQEAIQMLERAYEQKKNDPYIIDSIGWGYYLNGDYAKAEKYLKQAIQLMPNDPIVNDHYGDILWKLDRKLQARYFWESVLNYKTTEDDMKKSILKKLLKGPKET